ncbi:unnamed protein product [Symbiodinium natans]|uniref:LysR substrate-binding domain-containing protein n=1 Tax=Symbiodinium natans TaxID=878477 RepID=A0A812URN5_9DINO|nr:unnamed protein product [Symbiodinium natans]
MLHASMLPMLLSVLMTTSAVQRRMLYNRTELSIMIPEGRPMTSLPLVALQAHTHFPELQVQILYARANEEFVYTETTLLKLRNEGALVLTPMPERGFVHLLTQARVLESSEVSARAAGVLIYRSRSLSL